MGRRVIKRWHSGRPLPVRLGFKQLPQAYCSVLWIISDLCALKLTSTSQSSFGKKKKWLTYEPLCKILPVLSDGAKFRSSHLSSHLILKTRCYDPLLSKEDIEAWKCWLACARSSRSWEVQPAFSDPWPEYLCSVRTLDSKYLDSNSGFTNYLTLGMISNLSMPLSPKRGIVTKTVNHRAVLKIKWANTLKVLRSVIPIFVPRCLRATRWTLGGGWDFWNFQGRCGDTWHLSDIEWTASWR